VPGGPLPHAKNEVDRTTRSGDMAKPSADRQTDRHDLPTSQPDNRTAAVLPVPSCKLGNTQKDRKERSTRISAIIISAIIKQESRAVARKLSDAAAVLFGLKFDDNQQILKKYSHAPHLNIT